MVKKKMKLDWKSVNKCERNYVGQEVNQYGDECDLIDEIFQAEGPVCECGNKMILMKANLEKPDGEIEVIPDITSICHNCNVEDDGFFTENENNEIQWEEEEEEEEKKLPDLDDNRAFPVGMYEFDYGDEKEQ